MDNKKISTGKRTLIFYFFISFIILFEILRLGDLPGLYYDSLMADFTAIQFLSPSEYWACAVEKSIFDFPLIGALYHGNLTMFLTLFVTLLTGTTSVLQYHIQNALWGIGIIITMHLILRKARVNQALANIATALLATNSAYITSLLTQFYSFLPGTLFLLFSIFYLIKWKANNRSEDLFLVAFWGGLAIYVYFCYLFFLPAILLIVLFSEIKRWFKNYCILFVGYWTGLYLYLLGFVSRIFVKFSWTETQKEIAFLIFAMILALYNYFLYQMIIKRKNTPQKDFLIIGITLFSFTIGTALIYPFIITEIKHHNVSGFSANIFERIALAWHNFSNNLSDVGGQSLILGYSISIGKNIWRNLCIIINILWFSISLYQYLFLKQKHESKEECYALWSVLLQASFFLVSLVFATRLSSHHYTTVFHMTFLTSALQLQFIYNILMPFLNSVKQYIVKAGVILFGFLLVLNFINLGRLTMQIKRTGGNGYYTNQLNELAYNANQKRKYGEKELYVFPEWGFGTSFIYLTQGTIPCVNNSQGTQEFIGKRIEEGYQIVLAYWDRNNGQQYEERLKYSKDITIAEKKHFTLEGNYAFTTLTVYQDKSKESENNIQINPEAKQ